MKAQELSQFEDVAGLVATKTRIVRIREGLSMIDRGIDVVLETLGVNIEFIPPAPLLPVTEQRRLPAPARQSPAKVAAKTAVNGKVRKKRRTPYKNGKPLQEFIREYLSVHGPSTNMEIARGVLAAGYRTVNPDNMSAQVGTLCKRHFKNRNHVWHLK